jgi:hypothetical protein
VTTSCGYLQTKAAICKELSLRKRGHKRKYGPYLDMEALFRKEISQI